MFLDRDLQCIRDNEATISKQLIIFNALTDIPITSQKKTQLKLQNLASGVLLKHLRNYPQSTDFNNPNYRLFERIPAVPGTSVIKV